MRSTVSITSASDSIDLTCLVSLKSELGITTTDEDENLARWITQASRIIASYCDRTFARETVIETFRPDGPWPYRPYLDADTLYLDRWPIVSITSVAVDDTTLTASEYYLDSNKRTLGRLSTSGDPASWSARKSIVVSYIAGYELLETLPHDIEKAAIMLVKDIRSDASRDPNLISRQIDGVSSYRWWVPGESKSVLPADISGLLDPYAKKWVIA